jgi:hypothetical protein
MFYTGVIGVREGSKFQQFVAGLSQIPCGGRPVCTAIRQSVQPDDRQTAQFWHYITFIQ